MNVNDFEGIFKHIEDNPDDWLSYSILADWYEENGDTDRTEAVRWMIKERKRPFKQGGHSWFNLGDDYTSKALDKESNISCELYECLEATKGRGSFYKDYDSRKEAILDLMQAWIKVNK
jgi:hypothetical protein